MKQLLFNKPKMYKRKTKTIKICMKNYKQLFNENPIVINHLIEKYLGEGITKYCDDCEEITEDGDWLVKGHKYNNCFCPECYSVCCNDLCKEITHNDELEENDCNGNVYCEDCIDDFTFYCEGCNDNYCKGSMVDDICSCDGYTECDDCDSRYCYDCKCDDGIFLCEECGDWSCCRKFIMMGDGDLKCDRCIKFIKPNRCN